MVVPNLNSSPPDKQECQNPGLEVKNPEQACGDSVNVGVETKNRTCSYIKKFSCVLGIGHLYEFHSSIMDITFAYILDSGSLCSVAKF
jgi:hypothetical protein